VKTAGNMAFELTKGYIDLGLETKGLNSGMKGLGRKLAGFGMTAALGLGALTAGAVAAGGAIAGLIALASKQERAEAKIEAVLKATGHAAGYTADQMKGLARDLQKMTGIGDEELLDTQAIMASFKNIQGPEFKGAMLSLLDMSTVMGQDAKQSATQLGKALNDPVQGITALSRVGVTFTESQKEAIKQMVDMGDVAGAQNIILQELQTEFGGAAEAVGDTFSGKVQKAKSILGDMGEEIGKVFLPRVTKALDKFLGNSDAVFGWLETTLDVAGFIFNNWGDLVRSSVLRAGLGVVGFGLDVKHWFTEALPAYLKWFGENWRDVFKATLDFTKTVFTNISENFKNLWDAIKGYMSGEGWSFDWTPLTEGFESSIKELPDIAKRELSDLEKKMQRDIEDTEMRLGENWVANVINKGDRPELDYDDVEGKGYSQDEIDDDKSESEDKDDKSKSEDKDKDKEGSASFVDLGSMWKKMAEVSLADKQLNETVKQTEELKKQTKIMEEEKKNQESLSRRAGMDYARLA
jgi:hypothetical protein